jgi:hypothetical protein
MESNSDSYTLAVAIREQFPEMSRRPFEPWQTPPLNVLDCVLSLYRRYQSFCYPRVLKFSERRREITTLAGLRRLIGDYPTPLAFITEELNYRDERRAITLLGVTGYLLAAQQDHAGTTEQERLENWAKAAKPEDCWNVGVRGFGLAGFQYMRMLFGAQTAKPDVHIRGFVSDTLKRRVNDIQALTLLEHAAGILKKPTADVDYSIWLRRSGGEIQNQPGEHCV